MQYAEQRLRTGDLELRYIEAGEGEPLVWLHGGAGLHPSAGTDLLTRRFRVIALELPGFGSSGGDQCPNVRRAQRAGRPRDQSLGLSEYLLHGTSFGAATALHLALNHPRRVTRLILESPAAFRPVGWTPPDVETVRRGLFRHPRASASHPIDPEVARRDRELVNRLSLTVDQEALAARLRDLGPPTLVMFGDADTLTPPDLARLYCDNAPDCAFVLVRDAAHVISSDQPEVYATTVVDFARDRPRSDPSPIVGGLTHVSCGYCSSLMTTVIDKCSLWLPRGRGSNEERGREPSSSRACHHSCQCARGCGVRQQRLGFFELGLRVVILVGRDVVGRSTTSTASGTPIKFMTMGPINSPQFSLPSIPVGAQIAVNEVNSAGGINGRKVKLIACNDQNNPNGAAQCAREAIKGKVTALVGGLEDYDLQIEPLLNQAGIPWVGLTTADDYTTPNLFLSAARASMASPRPV